MKLVATSDLHGSLPKIPECDLLIIAGDVCPMDDHTLPYQVFWLDRDFRDWLEHVPAKHIVGIAGNHDFVFEARPEAVRELELPWHYLQDSGIELEGIKIYGLPWVPHLPGWAFHASAARLEQRYQDVPDDTDLVISHGPPQGILDNVVRRYGSPAANKMLWRVKPKLFVCGHVHEGYGHIMVQDTRVHNVSYMDLVYVPGQGPVEIDW